MKKNRIANASEKGHYNPQLETRVKCDASRSGLGAALELLTFDGWKPIAFFNSFDKRYSVNELELLGMVWSFEYFKSYLYREQFTIITDHRALLSILKKKLSNKSCSSLLTRWIDCLLQFQFNIEHLPGAKKGLVFYISRHPNQKAKKVTAYDEEFIVAKLKLISASVSSQNLNTSEPASHLQKVIKALDPAYRFTPKTVTIDREINLIGTHAARVHKHDYYISLVSRKQATNTNSKLCNSNYAHPPSQMPINTSFARRNTSYCKQLFQNWNE